MTEEKKGKKQKRNKPATNLTLSDKVRESGAVYKAETGTSLSTLANSLLQDHLEKKGYLKARKP